MSSRMALKVAIDLIHMPSQVRLLTAEPLPDGILTLLRIAAGDEEAENTASLLTDRPLEVVRQASTFYIEQILFASNADSYRVLGANPQASAGELRRNVGLLMRWLHPDRDPQGERAVFIGRVTTAWNDLKTPERRAAYDAQLRAANRKRRSRSKNSKLRSGKDARFVHNGALGRQSGYRLHTGNAEKIGFFRRALAVLFNRPLQ